MVKAARVEGVESVNSKHGHTKLSPLLNRPSTTIELDGYTLGDYLASGGCGTVMLCTKHNEPNKSYVLKYINLNQLTPHFRVRHHHHDAT